MSKHLRPGVGKLAGVLIAAALASPVFGAGQANADDVTVIRHLSNHGNVEPYEIANALGWLKEKNIEIDSQGYSTGGPESLVALAAGSVDIASAATSPIINAIASGAEIVAVVPHNGVAEQALSKFYVLEGSDIATPQDLKDKSIAVNTLGAHLDYVVREHLRNNDIDKEEVTLVVVPGPQLGQVLRHEQADVVAVGTWQSIFAGKIEADGGARVLFTDYEVLGEIVLGSTAIKKSFIEEHPQVVQDFVTASARAVDWTIANPEEAKQVYAEILGARGENPELAQYWTGYGLREHALYTEHDAKFWIDVLVREGRLQPGQLSPDDVLTNRFNTFASSVEG
jgi:ABC-type nitrate/sulfonate/bicarbonate transport system substrate-binding protein